jgi:hypothetical protein
MAHVVGAVDVHHHKAKWRGMKKKEEQNRRLVCVLYAADNVKK